MAASTLVSLDEYRSTSYHPDVEYIDGELKEKPLVQWTHSNLQSLLCLWFGQHRKEWNITVGVESRTQVSPRRVRLPDVVVNRKGRHPEILTAPPLIAIEILSPSDSSSDVANRIRDLLTMGIANVWMIDPRTRTGFVCTLDAPPQPTKHFEVSGTAIYLDLAQLFATFDEDNED